MTRRKGPRPTPMARRLAGELAGAVSAAGIAYAANRVAVAWSAADPDGRGPTGRWQRMNHAGRPVTLLEGPAAAIGALAGLAVRRRVINTPAAGRQAFADGVAVVTAAAVGGYDDLAGSAQAKGFRGHLGALRRGQLTTGMIKMVGVGASALAAALIDSPVSRSRSDRSRLADVAIDTGLVATAANLTNLLDLRPGRAAKAVIAGGLATGGLAVGAGPVLGASAGVLPGDLAARSMLGDSGANALGAGLGRAMTRLPRPLRVAALAGLTLLNLASERVSFTAVIAAHPGLDALDRWGRAAGDPARVESDAG